MVQKEAVWGRVKSWVLFGPPSFGRAYQAAMWRCRVGLKFWEKEADLRVNVLKTELKIGSG